MPDFIPYPSSWKDALRRAQLPRLRRISLPIAVFHSSIFTLYSSDELRSLADSYNKKVAEVTAPAAGAFAADLAKIAKTQAAQGNYLEAAATKSKATATLSFLESLNVSASSALVLPLAKATNIGPVSYSESTGILGRFTKENARASWELRKVKPGTYDVSLTYAVNHRDRETRENKNAGGTFQIREDTKLQRAGDAVNSITHEVTSTGSWESYRTETIGNITLASASATIVLEALDPEPQGLMELREIRLTPHEKSSPATAHADQSTKNLASLKRHHKARSAPLLASLTAAHAAEISSIKNAAAAAGDTKTIRRATDALLRLSPTSEEASAIPTAPPVTLAAVDDLKVQLAGTTTPNASRSYLTQLGPGGEGAITWQLPSERPDTQFYEASIQQRPTTASGGRLVLTAGKNEISHHLERPERNKLENPAFENTSLGVLEIPINAAAIQLRVLSLDPDSDTLADLESLILQPLDDSLAAKNAITLQDQEYKEHLDQSAQDWKEAEIATYLHLDTASADSFQIETASGNTLEITLYGINSPRTKYGESEEDIKYLEFADNYMKLSKSDLERTGRKALKFVEDTLAAGRCRVYTSDGAEDTRALIATPDGTPLSIALASEGFATDSYDYPRHLLPMAIQPDLSPKVYSRWLRSTIERAKNSKKGLWINK